MSWTHVAPAQEIHFGTGVVDRVGEVLRRVGARDTLVVTSPSAFGTEAARRLERALGHGLTTCFSEVEPQAPASAVQAAFLQARRDGVDSVVSLGGGSCADVAKAVCFFSEQEAGTPAVAVGDRPALPHVAVPTTYVGAAVSPSFWMTEPATGQARGGSSPTLAPVAVLADPEAVQETPADIRVTTAVTALAQAVEVAIHPAATPEAAATAQAGGNRILHSIRSVASDPSDQEAGSAVLEGAVLAARALAPDIGLVTLGLARLLAGRSGAAHRTLVAVLLPPVLRRVPPAAARELGRALGVDDVADAVAELASDLALPSSLSECEVGPGDIEATTRLAQSDPAFGGMDEDDLRSLLDDAA